MMRTIYLGLGTNLEHRDEWLDRGLTLLEEQLVNLKGVQAMSTSPRYETEAWGMAPGTPSFLNMVVAIESPLPLPVLLRMGLDIEKACGRIRNPESKGYQNRTLDVDVLCTSNGETWSGVDGEGFDLEVPHPRMMTRRFVLQPLVDLAPDLSVAGHRIQDALHLCPDEPSVRLHNAQPAEMR